MEYITANGTEYACKSVVTSIDAITFIMEGQKISQMETAFKEVESLTVAGEDKVAYGLYDNLLFESATVFEDGSIEVKMHIPSETELRIASLEQTQAEQDEVIAELIGGGEL